MAALRQNIQNSGDGETLEAVVARIQASRDDLVLPVPAADAVTRFAARVAHEAPMMPEDEAAWNHSWAHIVDEMRQRDHEDDVAKGCG